MYEKDWFKNFVFMGLIVLGISSLAYFLMATEQLQRPKSFSPDSPWQLDLESVVAKVDAAFENEQQVEGLSAAEMAPNLIIARRLALGLAGTIPSLEEIREFEKQPADEQVHWWVSRLLEDQRTSHHVAERLARAFVGVENGPFLVFRRSRFVDWLSKEFGKNTPYDVLARKILGDEGLWTDTPAVNFVTRAISEDENSQPDAVMLAGRTSRAFLGMRIDCLQCHDDFLGNVNLGSSENPREGTQLDFHSLAAFFGQVENSVTGIRDGDSRGPYQYRLLGDEEESEIVAALPFNQSLDSGDSTLRTRLANWVTHPENRPFARVTVNRMWAILFGRPMVEPVDDIPLEGPFPPAMEILVDDFIANQFNLHRLIRIIAQTSAFGRSSVHPDVVASEHVNTGSVFPLTQLRPDQVAGALIQSTKLTTIDSTAHIITRLTQFGQQNDFVERFGDPGEDEFEDKGETVTQRLLMLNGDMLGERLSNGFNTPGHLNVISPNVETAIEVVYLSVLTRRPTDDEKAHYQSLIANQDDREISRELVDLYWALINSAEFRWNH